MWFVFYLFDYVRYSLFGSVFVLVRFDFLLRSLVWYGSATVCLRLVRFDLLCFASVRCVLVRYGLV
jgi:hypothetical protein